MARSRVYFQAKPMGLSAMCLALRSSRVIPRIVGLLIVLVLIAITMVSNSNSYASSTQGAKRLPPAPDRPVSYYCRHSLLHDEDGNVQPLTCAQGHVNILAWKWYADNAPVPILALPRSTSLVDVEKALCRPQSSTEPMRISEYKLASIYNGWHFKQNPIKLWESVSCSKLVREAV